MADLEPEIEHLYGLPPEEFTPARNELAKRLRADGEREAAERVRALAKPSVSAWAINRLVRERRDDVGALLEAGDELRAAQEELLAGGERTALDRASQRERELVAELTAAAAGLLERPPSAAVRQRVEETLRAAALDEEARDEVRAGRLVKELSAASLGPFGTAAPPARKRAATRKKAAGKGARAAEERRKRKRRELEERVERERAAAAEADRLVEVAEAEVLDARRAAEQAKSLLAGAEREAERLRAKAGQAAARVDAAEEKLAAES